MKVRLYDPRARDLQTVAGWVLAAAALGAAFDLAMFAGGAGFSPIVVDSLTIVSALAGVATLLLMLAVKLESDAQAKVSAAHMAAQAAVVQPVVVPPPARPALPSPPRQPVALPPAVEARLVAPPAVDRPWLAPSAAPAPAPAAPAPAPQAPSLPPAPVEPSPTVHVDPVVAD